ncbi:MAG: aminotransferase class V-fold PLP-dependent enzyme [bacterium]
MMNFEEIREHFPVCRNLIYFDNAAVAPIHTLSIKYADDYLDHFLNYGFRDYDTWFNKYEEIREGLGKFIGAKKSEIAFIKNTSAGISVFANGVDFKDGDNVIIPNIEYPANVYPWLNLASKGVKTKFLKADNGYIDLNALSALIDCNTRVLSISWIEFVNGFKNDLKAISELCMQKSLEYGRKIYFCVDAIQGLGAFDIDVKALNIDFLAADGHKWFLALEGAGFLYCSEDIIDEIKPASVGWKSVENPLDFTDINFTLQKTANKFEEGTLNVVGILSLGASLDLFNSIGIKNIEDRILSLSNYAVEKISQKAELKSYRQEKHRSGIISFVTKDIEKDFLKLLANKVQLSKRGEMLRISPHFYNTHEEIDRFVDML